MYIPEDPGSAIVPDLTGPPTLPHLDDKIIGGVTPGGTADMIAGRVTENANTQSGVTPGGTADMIAGRIGTDPNADATAASTTSTSSSVSAPDTTWTDTSSADASVTTDQRNAIVQSGANPNNVAGVRQGQNGNTLVITKQGNIIGVRPDGSTFDAGDNVKLAEQLSGSDTNNVPVTGSSTSSTSSTVGGGGADPSRPPDRGPVNTPSSDDRTRPPDTVPGSAPSSTSSSTSSTTSSVSTADTNWTDTSSSDASVTTDQRNAIVQSGVNPDNVVGVRQGQNGNTLVIVKNGNIVGVRPDGSTFDAGDNKTLATTLSGEGTNNVQVGTVGNSSTASTSSTVGDGGADPSRPPDRGPLNNNQNTGPTRPPDTIPGSAPGGGQPLGPARPPDAGVNLNTAPPGVRGPVENQWTDPQTNVTYWVMSDGRVFQQGPNGNVYKAKEYKTAEQAMQALKGPKKKPNTSSSEDPILIVQE